MNVKLLIDGIMQQTTVLIGQLSTAAGVRAPLARVADQVFIDLARELEAQGVGRRVAADMFGLALRSYQKKVRRLTESASVREQTLWEAVLRHVQQHDKLSRRAILRHFRADAAREVGAVLSDLVGSGLLYHTGHGLDSLYGVTSDSDRTRMAREGSADNAVPRVWSALLDRGPIEAATLQRELELDDEAFRSALATLADEGKVSREARDGIELLSSKGLLIPVGAEIGWELAVFDHFRAVVHALAAKVATGRTRSQADDVVGGATLRFQIAHGHPYEASVRALLADVRARVNALWDEVERYNAEHGDAEEPYGVYFYFGQYVRDDARQEAETDP